MPPDRASRAVVLLALGVATSTAAVAGPPFLTDDPEPVDRHHAEIYLIAQQTRAASDRGGSASGEVNLGCAAEAQCHVAVPIAYDHAAGGSSQRGLGDVELGVKCRLLAQRSFGDALSLGVELFRRTSTADGRPSAAGFNVGAIVAVAPHQNLLVSAGRGSSHADSNRCSMFLAYQLEL